ncbi:MAG: 1-acyl-sn-glycerol-3-phosphate acyltransferase [Parcubacteria group bacterium Athens1014_10]|nr:MAG: 1-acyl-sn-glycerol-3-phosphate acyltransferase [Parcubacteria group bacterium Athens1014_10]TSD04747.1 MAG: 1-acyl-sn-glycerol-3-phosphate acyltransferase [Parcubacteria group bacterium Athens0714_12]
MAYFGLKHTLIPFLRKRIGKIEGIENIPENGGFIIAANHISYLDPPFIVSTIFPKAKTKIYFLGLQKIIQTLKKFLINTEWLGIIPVEREDKDKCLDETFNYLKKGNICVIFPEGMRNIEKELKKGKTGVARLALQAKAPVIPLGCSGYAGLTLFSALKNLFFCKKIQIKVGKPLYFDQYYNQEITKESLDEITKKIMLEIGKLCDKDYIY